MGSNSVIGPAYVPYLSLKKNYNDYNNPSRISVVLLSRLILNLKLQTDIPKQSFATSNASAPPRPVIIAPHILGNLTAELRDDDIEEVGPEEIGLNVLHIN